MKDKPIWYEESPEFESYTYDELVALHKRLTSYKSGRHIAIAHYITEHLQPGDVVEVDYHSERKKGQVHEILSNKIHIADGAYVMVYTHAITKIWRGSKLADDDTTWIDGELIFDRNDVRGRAVPTITQNGVTVKA